MKIAGHKENERMVKYFPGRHILSLFGMFGFITIQDDKPEPGKDWRILSVHKTSLGEAMLAVFSDSWLKNNGGTWR